MAYEEQNQSPPAQPRTSWRLTFRFDGDKIELVSQRQVQMIAPPAPAAAPSEGRSAGTWLELTDDRNTVLYHRNLLRLMGAEVEVFNPDGTIQHIVGPPRQGQFEIVVPDAPGATSVRVLASPSDSARAVAEPAREIARFRLRPGAPAKE